MTLAEQVKSALKSRALTTSDLAEIIGKSVRQTQQRLKDDNFTAEHIELISKALDWTFVIQASQSEYDRKEPITFSINLNPETAEELPQLIRDIETLLKERGLK